MPLLDLCQDLKHGRIYNFSGGMGSRRTSALLNALSNHRSHQDHISLYLNPQLHEEVKKASEELGCWGFSHGLGKGNQTDAGVFMLAAKAIRVASELKKRGK